jgi:bifunctional UDP-N-acetylglucosamine pyrophosphorylase / glucosamine-1-phosphate N-acetyltransferase
MVGPLRLDYGNVVAAGTILRKDCLDRNRLIITKTYRAGTFPFMPDLYSGLSRIVENNILYLANLAALKEWYIHVREPFFQSQELGLLIYKGALDKLALATKERLKRLKIMAEKIDGSLKQPDHKTPGAEGKRAFCDGLDPLSEIFSDGMAVTTGDRSRDGFLKAFMEHRRTGEGAYVATVQGLPAAVSEAGTKWLQDIIDGISRKAAALMPSLNLFKDLTQIA